MVEGVFLSQHSAQEPRGAYSDFVLLGIFLVPPSIFLHSALRLPAVACIQHTD